MKNIYSYGDYEKISEKKEGEYLHVQEQLGFGQTVDIEIQSRITFFELGGMKPGPRSF